MNEARRSGLRDLRWYVRWPIYVVIAWLILALAFMVLGLLLGGESISTGVVA